VLGARKDEVTHSQLPDATEALHLRRLDQVQDEVFGDGDEPVYRVREEFEALLSGQRPRALFGDDESGGERR
jgi:hypothetical protein